MEKILVTGFTPFGTNTINPSKEIVESIDTSKFSKVVIKAIIPTVWGEAQSILFELMDKHKPDKVVLIGLASGDDSIRIERIGINVCGAIKDNLGKFNNNTEKETKIIEDGEDGLFSTFDYEKIYKELREADIKVRMSFSAGQYLCNYVLYSALHKVKKDNLKTQVGFIHVPDILKENEISHGMSFETMKHAIDIIIENC